MTNAQCHGITKTGQRCQKMTSNHSGYCHLHQITTDKKKKTQDKDAIRSAYFKDEVPLSDRQKKWCRCVLHVAAQQPKRCLSNVKDNAGKNYGKKKCYNPYPICSASVGTSVRKCGQHYNYEKIPDVELEAYARLNHIRLPKLRTREALLEVIYNWKAKQTSD